MGSLLIKLNSVIKVESPDYSFQIKDVRNKWNLVGEIFIYNRGNEKI
jgi:hypothetical protein